MASRELSADTFESLLHERFGLADAEAELTEVERHPGDPRIEAFSLRFLANLPATAGQGMYRLRHPRLGEVDVFMTPIGSKPDGLLLEAVFNRVRGGA